MGDDGIVGSLIQRKKKIIMMLQETSGLPRGYTKVDYIASDNGQYIDTGIIGKNGVKSDIVFSFIEFPADGCVLGSRHINNRFYLLHYFNSHFAIGLGSFEPTTVSANLNTKYLVETDLTNRAHVFMKVDDRTILDLYSVQNVNTNLSMYLCNMNDDGDGVFPTKVKLYSVRIWDNGELVRDYIPCTNPNNEAGMYDIVSKTFFSSLSGQSFSYGLLQ